MIPEETHGDYVYKTHPHNENIDTHAIFVEWFK